MKKVSFYIPTLNSSKTIISCLKSVINQEGCKIAEIVVVDGNSIDDTISIVESMKHKSRIPLRVIKQKKRGLANARNLAVRYAKCKYIASIDADTIASRKWLKLLIETLERDKAAGTGGRVFEKYSSSLVDKWRKEHMAQNWGNRTITNPEFLFGSNTLFKKEAIKDICLYNESYLSNYEDVDLSKRLREKGHTLSYNPNAICYHLKKDTLASLLNTYYSWTFHSYPPPSNFLTLMLRLAFFNIYKSIVLAFKDLRKFNICFLMVDFVIYFHSSYRDAKSFFKRAHPSVHK